MQFLTRKSDAEAVAAPLWHTNFRNFERLPDTKVVRTTFFINTAAIALALGLLLWLGYREYRILDLREQIAGAQKEIDSNKGKNNEAIRMSQKFTEEQKKLAEALAFRQAPISPLDYITLLGQTLPKEIIIESLDARQTNTTAGTFVVRGLVAGTADQASGTANSYVDTLRNHPRIGAVFNPITLTNLNRDSSSGYLAFEIVFKVKAAAAGK